jgi:hypothetical protein
MEKYLRDVRRYDALADEGIVARIVSHLGMALRDRDGAFVAASDRSELDTVRRNWCGRRLGADNAMHVDRTIDLVCMSMAADRMKARVTFYYLCAKHLGRLAAI